MHWSKWVLFFLSCQSKIIRYRPENSYMGKVGFIFYNTKGKRMSGICVTSLEWNSTLIQTAAHTTVMIHFFFALSLCQQPGRSFILLLSWAGLALALTFSLSLSLEHRHTAVAKHIGTRIFSLSIVLIRVRLPCRASYQGIKNLLI